jgi:uncharacterized membrane protein YfcA
MTETEVALKRPKSPSAVWGQAVIYAAIFGFVAGCFAWSSWGAFLALVVVLLIAPNVPHHSVAATAAVTIVAVAVMLFVSVKRFWPRR